MFRCCWSVLKTFRQGFAAAKPRRKLSYTFCIQTPACAELRNEAEPPPRAYPVTRSEAQKLSRPCRPDRSNRIAEVMTVQLSEYVLPFATYFAEFLGRAQHGT